MAFNLNSGNATSDAAFDKEIEKLKKLQIFEESQAEFLTSEGKGIAKPAEIQFGDQTDLEDLSEEEQKRRATGRVGRDIGLFL